jgi:hypothetical protein
VTVFALVQTTLLQNLQPLLLLLPGFERQGPDHVHCLMCDALCYMGADGPAPGALQAVQAAGAQAVQAVHAPGALQAVQAAVATLCDSPHVLCMLRQLRTQQLKELLGKAEHMRRRAEKAQQPPGEQAANAAADAGVTRSMAGGGGGDSSGASACSHGVHESPLTQLGSLLRQMVDGK